MGYIVISASSDIGAALSRRWVEAGIDVVGTYRQKSQSVTDLEGAGVRLVECDLGDRASIKDAISSLCNLAPRWDALIIAPGTLDPIGKFDELDFDQWEHSVSVNFVAQMRLLHGLLGGRRRDHSLGPAVLMFAGGGVNKPVQRYSAYTISKIAQIKMCEFLDAEFADVRFSIVGPGWVKTKIHDQTLAAKQAAGAGYQNTVEKLEAGRAVPMEDVIACCDWVLASPRDVVGGRNFSTEFDRWGSPELDQALRRDQDMYKLRRHGNSALPPRQRKGGR